MAVLGITPAHLGDVPEVGHMRPVMSEDLADPGVDVGDEHSPDVEHVVHRLIQTTVSIAREQAAKAQRFGHDITSLPESHKMCASCYSAQYRSTLHP